MATNMSRILLAIRQTFPTMDETSSRQFAAEVARVGEQAVTGGWDLSQLTLVPKGVLRSGIGARLQVLRENRKLTLEYVAGRARWSTAKLGRIEHGLVGLSYPDLVFLLNLYGISGKAQKPYLDELERERGENR